MTFLELLNQYKIECGVSGPTITDVDLVSGETMSLRNWLRNAWTDLQMLHDGQWSFMRKSSSFIVPVGGTLLNIGEWQADQVNRWKIDSFRVAEPEDGREKSVPIQFVDYDSFLATVGLDPITQNKVKWFTVRPQDKAIIIAPAPDKAYRLFFEYHAEPQFLEDSDDVPDCPAKFHMLIVYEAMLHYGSFEAASEVLARATSKRRELLNAMRAQCLPPMTFGGPLA